VMLVGVWLLHDPPGEKEERSAALQELE